MKATISLLVALLVGGCAAGGQTPAPIQGTAVPPTPTGASEARPPRGLALGKAWVIFGADTVEAEVSDTDQKREKGLMNRNSVPDGTGMIFVFTDEAVRSFWMSDTYVPLDIAFLSSNLRVIDIQQMAAETTDAHDSAGPAMFALEVRKGWFADHRIRTGASAELVFGPR